MTKTEQAAALAPVLRMLALRYGGTGQGFAAWCGEDAKPRDGALLIGEEELPVQAFENFVKENGTIPAEVAAAGAGLFRLSCEGSAAAGSRMRGKICIVTGAAQGFGEGIARGLAAQGAAVVLADMNEAGAQRLAAELCAQYGGKAAVGTGANVADEDSVRAMVAKAVLVYGGLDLLVSCAGIAIAGSLEAMTRANFDKVTAVNYTGYFLCAKYAAEPMKAQRRADPAYTADIIEINSKSGLEGSKANFAYSGSKFGGVGLTQSFALELAEWGIKVNAVCPGNLLDGPLWSDPERGLFRQYLDAGKVPGAKTVADVRRFYEDKVPMKRGCTVRDVTCAVLYLVEQQYETGQALPVSGGQVMLN